MPTNMRQGQRGDADTEALGYSKGGFSTKIHLRCDGNGFPITFLLTVGERHEAVVFEQLMEQGAVKRAFRQVVRACVLAEWWAIRANSVACIQYRSVKD